MCNFLWYIDYHTFFVKHCFLPSISYIFFGLKKRRKKKEYVKIYASLDFMIYYPKRKRYKYNVIKVQAVEGDMFRMSLTASLYVLTFEN